MSRRQWNALDNHIRENLGDPISLADIATNLEISDRHLSHIFSRESRFTLFAYLGAERMETAARLMVESHRRIREIAYVVGYEDAHYFGQAFRRHFGCAPGIYRTRQLHKRIAGARSSAKKALKSQVFPLAQKTGLS